MPVGHVHCKQYYYSFCVGKFKYSPLVTLHIMYAGRTHYWHDCEPHCSCTGNCLGHTHITLTHRRSHENLTKHTVHPKSELSKYYLYVAEGEGTNLYSALIPIKYCTYSVACRLA